MMPNHILWRVAEVNFITSFFVLLVSSHFLIQNVSAETIGSDYDERDSSPVSLRDKVQPSEAQEEPSSYVAWHNYDPSRFKNRDEFFQQLPEPQKPLLFVVVNPKSQNLVRFEREILDNPDISALLSRYFVMARAEAEPQIDGEVKNIRFFYPRNVSGFYGLIANQDAVRLISKAPLKDVRSYQAYWESVIEDFYFQIELKAQLLAMGFTKPEQTSADGKVPNSNNYLVVQDGIVRSPAFSSDVARALEDRGIHRASFRSYLAKLEREGATNGGAALDPSNGLAACGSGSASVFQSRVMVNSACATGVCAPMNTMSVCAPMNTSNVCAPMNTSGVCSPMTTSNVCAPMNTSGVCTTGSCGVMTTAGACSPMMTSSGCATGTCAPMVMSRTSVMNGYVMGTCAPVMTRTVMMAPTTTMGWAPVNSSWGGSAPVMSGWMVTNPRVYRTFTYQGPFMTRTRTTVSGGMVGGACTTGSCGF